MSKPRSPEERDRLTEQALESYRASGGKTGISARWEMWKKAKAETTRRNHPKLLKAAAITATTLKWTVAIPAVGLFKLSKWALPRMYTRKNETPGRRHFAPIRSAFSTAAIGLCVWLTPHYVPMAYYYGTARTHQIYIPSAGVFQNQQFEKANEPDHTISKRDEVYTVLGRRIETGKVEQPTRYELDANPYFMMLRPDLAAAEMVPGSPYGATCTVKATGLYTLVPRFFRYSSVVRWLNIRPEAVKLEKDPGLVAWGYPRNPKEEGNCHQVTPSEFAAIFNGDRSALPLPSPQAPSGTAPMTQKLLMPEQK